MQTKLFFSFLAGLLLGSGSLVHAQCDGGRYRNNIYSVTAPQTVTYSAPYNLKMDIYQPVGDTVSKRPLVILAHGGNFFAGDRTSDASVTDMCTSLAKKGYVTVSIDYRLSTLFNMLDSASAVDAVVKAVSDGKAAVRFFVKDAQTANTYKIDTSKIFVGGNSAGAVLYMHAAYMDNLAECPSHIQLAINNNGGFDGNSGNDGYPLKIKGVINMAGGLNIASFISPGNCSAVNFHGDADNTVPYTCARAMAGSSVTLCGLGSLEPVFNAQGIYHLSKVFAGEGHCPWSSNAAEYHIVDSMTVDYLYSLVCDAPTSVPGVPVATQTAVYPNPAAEQLFIENAAGIQSVSMYDVTGRAVHISGPLQGRTYAIQVQSYPRGIYVVEATLKGVPLPVVRRVLLQ